MYHAWRQISPVLTPNQKAVNTGNLKQTQSWKYSAGQLASMESETS